MGRVFHGAAGSLARWHIRLSCGQSDRMKTGDPHAAVTGYVFEKKVSSKVHFDVPWRNLFWVFRSLHDRNPIV